MAAVAWWSGKQPFLGIELRSQEGTRPFAVADTCGACLQPAVLELVRQSLAPHVPQADPRTRACTSPPQSEARAAPSASQLWLGCRPRAGGAPTEEEPCEV